MLIFSCRPHRLAPRKYLRCIDEWRPPDARQVRSHPALLGWPQIGVMLSSGELNWSPSSSSSSSLEAPIELTPSFFFLSREQRDFLGDFCLAKKAVHLRKRKSDEMFAKLANMTGNKQTFAFCLSPAPNVCWQLSAGQPNVARNFGSTCKQTHNMMQICGFSVMQILRKLKRRTKSDQPN